MFPPALTAALLDRVSQGEADAAPAAAALRWFNDPGREDAWRPSADEITAIGAVLAKPAAESTVWAALLRILYFEGLAGADTTDQVKALLRHPDPTVRARAAGALDRYGADVVTEALARLLEDPLAGRAAIVSELTERGNDDVIAKIERLLGDDDADVRYQAVRTLHRVGAAGRAPELVALLDDPSRNVQEAALYALGRVGDRRAFADVLRWTASVDDAEIMADALRIAARLGGSDALDLLLRGAVDESPQVRDSAVRAIADLADPGIPAQLTQRVNGQQGDDARWASAVALGRLGMPEALTLLETMLHSGDPVNRVVAAEAISCTMARRRWTRLPAACPTPTRQMLSGHRNTTSCHLRGQPRDRRTCRCARRR